MAEIRKHYNQFQKLKTDIYALSVDSPKQSSAVSKEMGLPFKLLCDEEKKAIRLYGLLNPHEHGGIAYNATFIIKKDGIIGFRSLDRTANRIKMNTTINYLNQLYKNPDFSLSSATHPQKNVIWLVLSVGTLLQISRNMVMRGNWEDWKHYISFPWKTIKSILRKKTTP